MVITYAKLVKANGKVPDELEKSVSNALVDLTSSAELKGLLDELYFVAANVIFFFFY